MKRIAKEVIRDKECISYKGEIRHIDWQGWDITKAIKHLYEMNPTIIEFIYSPIIYVNSANCDFMQRAMSFIEGQDRICPILTVI